VEEASDGVEFDEVGCFNSGEAEAGGFGDSIGAGAGLYGEAVFDEGR
jgi:hypothetical protein